LPDGAGRADGARCRAGGRGPAAHGSAGIEARYHLARLRRLADRGVPTRWRPALDFACGPRPPARSCAPATRPASQRPRTILQCRSPLGGGSLPDPADAQRGGDHVIGVPDSGVSLCPPARPSKVEWTAAAGWKVMSAIEPWRCGNSGAHRPHGLRAARRRDLEGLVPPTRETAPDSHSWPPGRSALHCHGTSSGERLGPAGEVERRPATELACLDRESG